MKAKNDKFADTIKLITTIISWTIFTLLMICAALLVYYFIATRIYMKKGSGYEPKFSLYTIVSPSMVPNIKVYDVVVDVRVDKPEDVKINDVITFNSENPELHGGTITHRVISITKDNDGNYYYQTKGDSNLTEDDEIVSFNKIVGKVSFKIPQLGRLQFFLASSAGWLLLILVPALYIIVKDILKILHLVNDTDDLSKLSKFKAFLNKPLLVYQRPKLLKWTPQVKASNESVKPVSKKKKKNTVKPNVFVQDDDIDLNDLPSLK